MNVVVHQARCIGAGQCVITAPALFDQREEDGIVVLLDPAPGPGLWDAAREATLSCPAGAITTVEEP
ncbi:ferredoxin [Nonomuraea sp. NPDC000554]|uniref:ferredoxin n=1 Tax=Nonomuraea sp. NPDC000554 TaxID=3154259 RepID=UPI003331802B